MVEPGVRDNSSPIVDRPVSTSNSEHHVNTKDQASKKSTEKVRLASFSPCRCHAADCPEDHLAVTTTDIGLDEAKRRAVAISYTWGEFDRSDVTIGHRAGKPAEIVWMQLGVEWSANNFVKRLVELTKDENLCWIDQICVPQKEEQIRQTLSAIPTIYRTLPVVALFPGSLCRCLQAAYDEYQPFSGTSQECSDPSGSSASQIAYDKLQTVVGGMACINSNGSCAWATRIWPSQELRYSTSIKVMWTDEETAECYRMKADGDAFEESEIPERHASIYRKVGNVAQSQENMVVRAIQMKNKQFINDLGQSLGHAMRLDPDAFTRRKLVCLFAEFLLGKPVTIDQEKHTLLADDDDVIARIMDACETLSHTKRQATEPRDYIISVWVGWTGYKIPLEFKQMSAWELLADTMRQFQALSSSPHTQMMVPTRCPTGLLSEYKPGSAQWDVSKRLHCETIDDSRDLYRLFEWNSACRIPTACIPLKLLGEQSPSSGSDIVSFEEWAEDLELPSIARNFNQCVDSWRSPDRSRFQLKWILPLTEDGLKERRDDFDSAPNMWAALFRSQDRAVSAEIILRLVCDALHLDFEVCKRNGIDLMFAQRCVRVESRSDQQPASEEDIREISCIGLVNWQKLRDAWGEERSLMSVALWSKHPEREGPFYEVACIGEDPPRYAVIGIWLPLKHEVTAGGPEAYIHEDWELEDIDCWII